MSIDILSKPTVIWFILSVGLFLLELVMPGFVAFYFGLGALIVFFALKFGGDYGLSAQLGIFLVSSIALMLPTRKLLVRRFFKTVDESSEFKDDFIGYEAVAEEDITDGNGRVSFRGTSWNAKISSDCSEGDLLTIKDVQGNILIVEKSEGSK